MLGSDAGFMGEQSQTSAWGSAQDLLSTAGVVGRLRRHRPSFREWLWGRREVRLTQACPVVDFVRLAVL